MCLVPDVVMAASVRASFVNVRLLQRGASSGSVGLPLPIDTLSRESTV